MAKLLQASSEDLEQANRNIIDKSKNVFLLNKFTLAWKRELAKNKESHMSSTSTVQSHVVHQLLNSVLSSRTKVQFCVYRAKPNQSRKLPGFYAGGLEAPGRGGTTAALINNGH